MSVNSGCSGSGAVVVKVMEETMELVVHEVFGASNVSKLLRNVPVHKRFDAVITVCYEAQARLRDLVYGCVAHIFTLQQQ
ncbi:hypothetical protein RYX36_023904, partial [Vicia faba]